MKKMTLGIISIGILLGISLPTFAQDSASQFHIIPESKNISGMNEAISGIVNSPGHVQEKYREAAENLSLEDQIATGIMDRNTLINYIVYFVRFLSQLGLFAGAAMIIYAGYQYATNVFGGKVDSGKRSIKYAIIGVIVIACSYAIMKTLTSMFLE